MFKNRFIVIVIILAFVIGMAIRSNQDAAFNTKVAEYVHATVQAQIVQTMAVGVVQKMSQASPTPGLNAAPALTVKLQTSKVNEAGLWDYCSANEYTRDSSKERLGTPVPSYPVTIGPSQPLFQLSESMRTQGDLETPIPSPTEMQTDFSGIRESHVQVTEFKNTNLHFVFIGDGFPTEKENESNLYNLITQVETRFSGVNVDFAYVPQPISLALEHTDSAAKFNEKDLTALFLKLQKVSRIDRLFILVNSPIPLASSNGYVSFMSTGLFASNTMAIHEMGHQIGMADEYQDAYNAAAFPSSELFYLDQKLPDNLVKALNELGYSPPIYLMGNCNGRNLYSFYDTKYNVYGDYTVQPMFNWDYVYFTPLQKILMNDFIKAYRGG